MISGVAQSALGERGNPYLLSHIPYAHVIEAVPHLFEERPEVRFLDRIGGVEINLVQKGAVVLCPFAGEMHALG
jgi:hypothetical protein